MTKGLHSVMQLPSVLQQYHALTKPRVIQLIVFCALIGMVLAIPVLPNWHSLQRMAWACLGIWLVPRPPSTA